LDGSRLPGRRVGQPSGGRRFRRRQWHRAAGNTGHWRGGWLRRPADHAWRRQGHLRPVAGHPLGREIAAIRAALGRALIWTLIWTLAPGRHETDDPPVAGVYHEPAVLAAAVDHGDSVDEAALVRHAEWRKAVVAQHRIDFLRRQQSRA